jgi:hypothetical protein
MGITPLNPPYFKRETGEDKVQRCSARLQPRARERLHDLERSHYITVCHLDFEICSLFGIWVL